jgi:carbon-monoxide dehydrogenase medium subunit
MKSAPFTYHRPSSLEEALALKAQYGGEARVLAGGQSLMPLMHFRLAAPSHLIDVNRLAELGGISRANGHISIGAAVRQAAVLASTEVTDAAPLLAAATGWIGHAQIRHRGTVAGSIAHADPSAELPAALLASDGSVVAGSVRGERVIAATDLFTGPFSTSLEDDEVITEVRIPVAGPAGAAWNELSRIYHGFPVVGMGAVVEVSDGKITRARVAACGMAGTAVLVSSDELIGREPTAHVAEEYAAGALTGMEPPADVHGSTKYRLRVGRAYLRRVLAEAFATVGGSK